MSLDKEAGSFLEERSEDCSALYFSAASRLGRLFVIVFTLRVFQITGSDGTTTVGKSGCVASGRVGKETFARWLARLIMRRQRRWLDRTVW